jgi:hypothetical protein
MWFTIRNDMGNKTVVIEEPFTTLRNAIRKLIRRENCSIPLHQQPYLPSLLQATDATADPTTIAKMGELANLLTVSGVAAASVAVLPKYADTVGRSYD